MKNIENFITELLSDTGTAPDKLLQHLCAVQQHYSCIPEKAVELLADSLPVPAMQISGVIDFYAFLHREARGDFDIYFSDSITDRMSGSRPLLDDLCKKLGIKPGVPRPDGRVTVDATSCTGICDQDPALLVNGLVVSRLNQERIGKIAELIETGTSLSEWSQSFFNTVIDSLMTVHSISSLHEKLRTG
jgi:[NiFe] hydrogenase diaphorase moiety large subunit